MEYMKNTFKMRKETKCDTILRKAKEPKGGRPTTRPSIWKKMDQTQTKRSSNGVKLYGHDPHIPRGPPYKTWAKMVSPGVDRPLGSPVPL